MFIVMEWAYFMVEETVCLGTFNALSVLDYCPRFGRNYFCYHTFSPI
jgi:hypothetical protein